MKKIKSLASALVTFLLALVCMMLMGCCSVKVEDVILLEKSIRDERDAVTVRAGLEEAVSKQRASQDRLLNAWKDAVR